MQTIAMLAMLPLPIWKLILLLLGFVLVVLSAFGVNHPRCNLAWLGVACWMLVALSERFGATSG